MIAAAGWVLAALLVLFVLAGFGLLFRELRQDGVEGERPRTGLRKQYLDYFGPLPLETDARRLRLLVVAEFAGALLGFPGAGWMVSGRVAVGLPLLVSVPALMWAVYPLYLGMAPRVGRNPLVALAVLPAIACVSASLLAVSIHKDRVR